MQKSNECQSCPLFLFLLFMVILGIGAYAQPSEVPRAYLDQTATPANQHNDQYSKDITPTMKNEIQKAKRPKKLIAEISNLPVSNSKTITSHNLVGNVLSIMTNPQGNQTAGDFHRQTSYNVLQIIRIDHSTNIRSTRKIRHK